MEQSTYRKHEFRILLLSLSYLTLRTTLQTFLALSNKDSSYISEVEALLIVSLSVCCQRLSVSQNQTRFFEPCLLYGIEHKYKNLVLSQENIVKYVCVLKYSIFLYFFFSTFPFRKCRSTLRDAFSTFLL